MLTARKLVQSKLLDFENSLRGICAASGLRSARRHGQTFAERIGAGAEGHPNLQTIVTGNAAGACRSAAEFSVLRSACARWRRLHEKARLLMSTPASGQSSADLGLAMTIPPLHIRQARRPYFGLTPNKYQSARTDYTADQQTR